MRLKKIIPVIFLLYMLIFLKSPLVDGNDSTSIVDINGNEIIKNLNEEGGKKGIEITDSSGLLKNSQAELDEEISVSNEENLIEDALNGFSPNISLTGDYLGEPLEGNFEDENSSIFLPSNGQYSLEGNITDLQSQYINNPGAEDNQEFYSEGTIKAGVEVERLHYSGSWDGEYVWKFYSYNSESIMYALNQKDITLYNTNTKISYNYLLASNSSLQYVLNSSLIFDFVFDTCRIMVIHWHYTDVEPPSIGDNTTSPFIVYRLLQNSSWDNQWNDYTLYMSDLFSEEDPLIPTMLKSFGIYVISPEVSDCTVLFDDLKLETSLTPSDINLRLNDIQINSANMGEGDFNADILFEGTAPYEYNLGWYHNSNYKISANFTVRVSGVVSIPYEQQISFQNEISILLSISISNLSLLVNPVNFSYSNTWLMTGSLQGADILSDVDIGGGYRNLLLARKAGIYDIGFQFILPNQIESISIENLTIFETLNATFIFRETLQNNLIELFWVGAENGSATGELVNEELEFTFPPGITSGSVEITFLVIENNLIGYENATVTLTREASELIVEQEINIPQYALKEISVSYLSLNHLVEIENATISGIFDNEILPCFIIENQYVFRISSFYLTENNYTLEIHAASSSHATIRKTVNILIYDSEINIDFKYENAEISSDFLLHFNVTSDNSPVGLVPITIEINEYGAHTGVTDEYGFYTHVVSLPQNLLIVNINSSIFKAYTPIVIKTFQILLENLLITAEKGNEDVIIAENITLTYNITYPTTHDRWIYYITDDMMPLLDVYVETNTLQIPVHMDSNALYWHIQADSSIVGHKLKITTVGPSLLATTEENDDMISIHFIINSEVKSYSDVSMLYYLNESYSTSKYEWKLMLNGQDDVTSLYGLQVNDLYIYVTNLQITKGSALMLDLVGIKVSNTKSITNVVVPLVSSSGVLLGAITAIVKVYKKKKGMVLEI